MGTLVTDDDDRDKEMEIIWELMILLGCEENNKIIYGGGLSRGGCYEVYLVTLTDRCYISFVFVFFFLVNTGP